jgi:hypothetical protein
MSSHSFELKCGTEVGVPKQYGGDGDFCVCTINIPGHTPIVAYKPVKSKGNPDEWVVACTKTLGRALKKAGYPDDLTDLKALVLWRQRDAEINALRGGIVPGELPTIAAPLEIEVSSNIVDEDLPDDVDVEAESKDGYSDVVDADVVDTEEPAAEADDPSPVSDSDSRWEEIVVEVEALSKRHQKDFAEFLSSNSIPVNNEEWNDDDLDDIEKWLSEPGS